MGKGAFGKKQPTSVIFDQIYFSEHKKTMVIGNSNSKLFAVYKKRVDHRHRR